MRSNIFNIDWEKFDYKDPVQRRHLLGALQYFCAIPNKFIADKRLESLQAFVEDHKEFHSAMAMQYFGSPADFPATQLVKIFEKFHVTTDFDSGYEMIFDVGDFTGTNENGFDVLDVQSGLAFRRVKVGEKAYVYGMSGERHRCYFDYYAGALGWHRSLFDDKEYWTIEDNAIEFRNKAYATRAQTFYSLIEAISDEKDCCKWVPAMDCYECDRDAIYDARAINYGAYTVLEACRDKGYGLNPATTQFIVLTPLNLRGRIRLALGRTNQHYVESEKVIDYNFVQVTSMMLANPNRFYVILPKRKLKAGYRMDLTVFSDFDILSYTDTGAGWMRYGGCIGDIDQIECIDLEPQSGECSGGGGR